MLQSSEGLGAFRFFFKHTFVFLYLTKRKEKQKNGKHSFYKNKTKHRARRVEEVRLRDSRYKLDIGWDSSRYRGWKSSIFVWNGAASIGSVSKTKTRHNIVFVFFFSNSG